VTRSGLKWEIARLGFPTRQRAAAAGCCGFDFRKCPLGVVSGRNIEASAGTHGSPMRCGEIEAAARFPALDGRIEAALPTRVRRCSANWDTKRQGVTGLDVWGQMVLDDIWAEMIQESQEIEIHGQTSLLREERESLGDFVRIAREFSSGAATSLASLKRLLLHQLKMWFDGHCAFDGCRRAATRQPWGTTRHFWCRSNSGFWNPRASGHRH
jgi:hypothetical protein